ncbi:MULTISPECIES: N-acetyltransferase [unclassified Gilliamella]|uniref:N-acetyltransferase n=1 Tax=unclassified Gilliamella TaxID=2685620 RepID=UPI000A34F595|nr:MULTISPECIES: N-acetyltransferase [unclassified Gilliamella]OTQ72715.1 N-acetyltransferase [Gilliamella sp. N-G2]OTQ78321.1 N-acetyltransferase [Gilliamella sp. N-W3]
MDNLKIQKFGEINFSDSFFDTLKKDYSHGFVDWWHKKVQLQDKAFVLYNDNFSTIDGFMYLKLENNIDDVDPPLTYGCYLKVGTFKFNPAGTLRGERFIKKIFDVAIAKNVQGIYVTVFDKHDYLIKLFKRYGFFSYGIKKSSNGREIVLLKKRSFTNDLEKDYPYINTQTNKYLLAIYPQFHTQLFPDSILKTESSSIIHDVSHTNSIHKVYISKIQMLGNLKKGDIIVIYRTAVKGQKAYFSAVATSICVIEEVRQISSFANKQEYLEYCTKYSVFTTDELNKFFDENHYRTYFPCYVIKFTYNIALSHRPNRAALINEVGLNGEERWSCLKLNEKQFDNILKLGEINESLIIN